jgi:hypothetical protein
MRAPLRNHVCVPYQSGQEQQHLLTAALVDGLRAGERVIFVTDTTPAGAVASWLREAGVEPGPLITRGQLVIDAGARLCLVDGRFDPARSADKLCELQRLAIEDGYPGLRVAGEMSTTLVSAESCELLYDYETRVSSLVAAGLLAGVTKICQYDLRRFTPEQVGVLEKVHELVLRVETLAGGPALLVARLPGCRGLRLSGEIDVATYPTLVAAVDGVLDLDEDLVLDMGEVGFVDATAIRFLARISIAMRPGRRLVVYRPPLMFRAVLRAGAWDPLPGLVIED